MNELIETIKSLARHHEGVSRPDTTHYETCYQVHYFCLLRRLHELALAAEHELTDQPIRRPDV